MAKRVEHAGRNPRPPGRLILQRLAFVGEVHALNDIDQGASLRLREQERTLAQRLIEELPPRIRPEAYDYRGVPTIPEAGLAPARAQHL